jgi:hypothetical protein
MFPWQISAYFYKKPDAIISELLVDMNIIQEIALRILNLTKKDFFEILFLK